MIRVEGIYEQIYTFVSNFGRRNCTNPRVSRHLRRGTVFPFFRSLSGSSQVSMNSDNAYLALDLIDYRHPRTHACMHAYIVWCLLRSRPHRRIDHWRLTAMRFGVMSLFGGFPGFRTRGMVRALGRLAGDSHAAFCPQTLCVADVRDRWDPKHAWMDMTLLRTSAFSHIFLVSWLQCYPLVKPFGTQLTSCSFVLCLAREARALYI